MADGDTEKPVYDLGVRWKDLDMKKFVAIGSSVYLAECAVIYPFELIKTRQQVATTTPHTSLIKSTLVDFQAATKTNGVKGLYRGFWMSSVGTLPCQAVYVLFYNYLKDVLDQPGVRGSSFWVPFVAGATADFTGNLLFVPPDVMVQRMQLVGNRHKNTWELGRHIYRTEGLRGFYRGLGATLARDTPSSAIWWAAYEWMKEYFSDHDPRTTLFNYKPSWQTTPKPATTTATTTTTNTTTSEGGLEVATEVTANTERHTHHVPAMAPVPMGALSHHYPATTEPPPARTELPQNHLAQVLAGAIAGVVTTVAMNPVDIVKTRLQTQNKESTYQYKNWAHGLKELIRVEGVSSFTRGIVPRLISVAPVSGCSSLIYELVLKASKKDQ